MNDSYYKYIESFFRVTETTDVLLATQLLAKGQEYKAAQTLDLQLLKQNFMFVLKLCRGKGPVPLTQKRFPKAVVGLQLQYILKICNVDEALAVTQAYEALLENELCYSRSAGGKNAAMPDDLDTLLWITSMLVDMHRRYIPSIESRAKHFVKLGNDIIAESEEAFGVSTSPKVIMAKAMLSATNASVIFGDGDAARSRTELHGAMEKVELMNDPKHNADWQPSFNESYSGMSEPDVAAWQRFMDNLGTTSDHMKRNWDSLTKTILGDSELEPSSPVASSSTVFQGGSTLFNMADQLATEMQKADYKETTYKNNLDRGHWSRAMGYHTGRVLQGFEKLDFNNMRDHLDAQEDIARRHGVFNEQEARFHDTRDMTDNFESILSIMKSGNLPEAGDFTAFYDVFSRVLRNHGVESPGLAQLFANLQESLVRDTDPSLIHNFAPGVLLGGKNPMERLQAMLKKHVTFSSRNPAYRETMLLSFTAIMSTLQTLERAEDEGHIESIFLQLDELDRLARDKPHTEFLDASSVQSRRQWNTDRLIVDVSSDYDNMTKTGNLDETSINLDKVLGLLNRIETVILLSKDDRQEIKDKLQGLLGLKEVIHLKKLFITALDEPNEEIQVHLLDEILELERSGGFSHAQKSNDPSTYLEVLLEVKERHFLSSTSSALSKQHWGEGQRLFAEWRANKEVWVMTMASSRRQHVLRSELKAKHMALVEATFASIHIPDTELRMKFMALVEAFFAGLDIPDVSIASARLNELRDLHKVSHADMPTLSSMTDIIAFLENILAWTVRAIIIHGPTAARRYTSKGTAMLRGMDFET
jgi:hypothetical protein